MGGGKGLANRFGASSTRLVDNAAAAEGIRTPGEGARGARPGAQSKLPECCQASGWNRRPGDVSRAKPLLNLAGCAARETSCLRCKKPRLRLGTAGSRVRVRSRLIRMSA